jgi:integrase
LNQAVKWSLIARNAASLVEPPRYKRPEIEPFTPEELQIFLKAIKGDRLEAFYLIGLALGLRECETLGLPWQDIDFTNRTLRVSVALQRIKGKGLQLNEPKTDRSRRTLPLPESIATALHTRRIKQLEEKMVAGNRWRNTYVQRNATNET